VLIFRSLRLAERSLMTISPLDQNGEQTQVYRAGRGHEELVIRQVVIQSELVQHAVEPLGERRGSAAARRDSIERSSHAYRLARWPRTRFEDSPGSP
jgi:hypothetical protein